MSVLKALQKKQAEEQQPQKSEANSNLKTFDRSAQKLTAPPEGFLDKDFKMSSPHPNSIRGSLVHVI